jgi:hypothetical protein
MPTTAEYTPSSLSATDGWPHRSFTCDDAAFKGVQVSRDDVVSTPKYEHEPKTPAAALPGLCLSFS